MPESRTTNDSIKLVNSAFIVKQASTQRVRLNYLEYTLRPWAMSIPLSPLRTLEKLIELAWLSTLETCLHKCARNDGLDARNVQVVVFIHPLPTVPHS